MATNWTISVDWNGDGAYTQPIDEVTNWVLEANWFLGMRTLYQDLADNATLRLTLRNDDRRFSPENNELSNPLRGLVRPRRQVRIQSNDGTTTRTHWTGWIESIRPGVNINARRTAELLASGPMPFYTAAETKIPLQENKRSDEVIAALLAEVSIPNTPAPLVSTGNTAFPYVGDNWVRQGGMTDLEKDTFDVYRAIGDVTTAERGRFFFDREARAVFWNRHFLLMEQPVAATFTDTMTGLEYTYAGEDQLRNEISVACQPRSITPGVVTLWQLEGAIIEVLPNSTRRIYIKYMDDSGNRIGGYNVSLTGVTFAQGTAAASVNPKANGAELVFVNSGSIPAIVQTAVVQGRRLTTFDRLEAVAKDDPGITAYGRRTMRLSLPSLSSLADAQYIADFELRRRKDPKGRISALMVTSHGQRGGAHHDKQLGLTMGSRIVVTETQTGHSANYIIVGEMHHLRQGTTLYQTTWYLEPAPAVYPWKLGDTVYSRLSSTTILAY
jgi:hypothetical protein